MSRLGIVSLLFAVITGNLNAASGITGFVTNDGEYPVQNALIRVFVNPYGGSIAEEVTDASGLYTIYLSPGTYYVHCFKEGYTPMWWEFGFSPQDADPVCVDSIDGLTTGIDFILMGGYSIYGFIEGTVEDEYTGESIDSANVSFYLQGSYHPVASTLTDFNGNYIHSLYPTDVGYLVKADKDGYTCEWYYESTTQDNAQPVTVGNGETTSNIDFTLSPLLEPGSISGYVLGDDSVFIQATLYLYADYWGIPVDIETVDQGFYNFEDLESGYYFVFCDAGEYGEKWWDEEFNPEDADTISVTSGQAVIGVNFYFGSLSGDRSVAGWVLDEQSGSGIEGASVVLYSTTGPRDSIIGYSDVTGRYTIRRVPPESLIAVAHARGYISEWYFDSESLDSATPFWVLPGEVLDSINFDLASEVDWMPCCISGRVTTQGNIPLVSAWIFAYRNGRIEDYSSTDSAGYYTLDSLEEGTYYLVARAWEYNEEWYNESPDFDGAEPLMVISGDEITGIDFTLQRIETGFITGEVNGNDSVGITGAIVWAEGIDNWGWGYTETDATGDYLLGLEPGYYTVSAYSQGYEAGFYPDPVEVVADQITPQVDIFLSEYLPEDGLISGRVIDNSTGEPLEDVFVMVFSNCHGNDFFGYALSDESGNYSIENIPVVYCLCYYAVALAPGYISEFYDNVYVFEDATPLNAFAEEVDFYLDRDLDGPMGVSGRVLAEKSGVGNALIFAINGPDIVASTKSSVNGNFKIRGLPPGVYTITATAVGYETKSYPYPVDVSSDNAYGINMNLLELLSIDEDSPVSSLFLRVTPSPARINPIVVFVLPRDCEIALSLYDVTGRVVKDLKVGYADRGTYIETIEIGDLTQGVYFVRLQAGKSAITKKVIIVR